MAHPTCMARWSGWTPSLWLCGTLLSLILGSAPLHITQAFGAASGNFPGEIRLQDGKLTARIKVAPLRQVMEEISRLSGARVRWLSQGGDEPVSVEFPPLPFPEALRRILGEKNFLLFYSSSGEGPRLARIWISSKGKPGGQGVFTLQPVPEGRTTSPPADDLTPRVGENIDALIQTAMHDQDPLVRLDAITQLGGYAQEDARVKAILSQVARSDSNPQVQEAAAEMLQNVE